MTKSAKPRSWTSKEVERCWKLKKAGLSNREIGLILKRSAGSVHYLIGKTYDYMR